MDDKRSKCHFGKSCAAKSCDDCEPSLKPRFDKCYNYYCPPGVCFLDGGPCSDGWKGKLCDCFVDKSDRPSENHILNLQTGKWELRKKEKKHAKRK